MRALQVMRAICAVALLGPVLLMVPGSARADVFGRPDNAFARHASNGVHPIPMPDFVRHAVRVVIVEQAHLDEALQDDVLSLRSLGSRKTDADDSGAWLRLMAFVGLCLAYALLGACWLVKKCEGNE